MQDKTLQTLYALILFAGLVLVATGLSNHNALSTLIGLMCVIIFGGGIYNLRQK